MQKYFIDREKRVSKAAFMLLFLSVLILAIIVTPVTKAAGPTITLVPSQAPAGQTIMAYIQGFDASATVTITFGTTSAGGALTNIVGNANAIITVPLLSPRAYTVTATDSSVVATTTFTITGAPTPTPGTTAELGPANTPLTVTVSNGFWSPLTIAVTSVVVAFAVFMTLMYVKRGRQKPLSYSEDSRNEPRPSTPAKTSYAPSRTNQPATKSSYQPYSSAKINQPATTSQQQSYTRVCRHCKRSVRDDQNICPYCSKRLR